METLPRIKLLLEKYFAKRITTAEFDELLVWMHGLNDDESEELRRWQQPYWEQAFAGDLPVTNVNWELMLQNIQQSEAPVMEATPMKPKWWRFAAAAAILIFIVGSAYFLFTRNAPPSPNVAKTSQLRAPENVLPNINKTMLSTSSGKEVVLDSAANGDLSSLGIAGVAKLSNGQLTYNNAAAAVEYHTITVPRGGRPYEVTLSDGSRVWINVESSLRFPSKFTGNQRKVELRGECYFEVAKDPSNPFYVSSAWQTVQVLGTHFDIMSYTDEDHIVTTLLEGSVKVMQQNGNAVVIQPGEAALLNKDDKQIQVREANTALATAWVKGYFQFDKANVPSILRQVARWYDLDIEYRGKVPTDIFSGKIERSLPLSSIMKLFEQGQINGSVEGKKLVIK